MKTILITGGSKGLGLAIANLFSKDYNVITTAQEGDVTITGDIRDVDFRNKLVDLYTPDIFVNNAGVISDLQDTIETNLIAAIDLLEKFYNKMPEPSHIVNVSSNIIHNKLSDEAMPAFYYKASKVALDAISQDFSKKNRNIRVTSFVPGVCNTTMIKGARRANSIPPEYIAETIKWLVTQPHYISIPSINVVPKVKKIR
jgi:NAD(P)-dependent dehydrogenase (short-subunit alcohol dehydrogenase family)